MIPARLDFDTVHPFARRCVSDGAVLDEGSEYVPGVLDGSEFRTVEERVRGWVGIQRFDDNNKFGVDLIRNGRSDPGSGEGCVLQLRERTRRGAQRVPDGPANGPNHRRDPSRPRSGGFPEAGLPTQHRRVAASHTYLRGDPCSPATGRGATKRDPGLQDFQGYRKVPQLRAVRTCTWAATTRPVERPCASVGKSKPNFTEGSSTRSLDTTTTRVVGARRERQPFLRSRHEECARLRLPEPPDEETCGDCGRLFRAKYCVWRARKEIAILLGPARIAAPSQIPEVAEPWRCAVCGDTNGIDDERCTVCDACAELRTRGSRKCCGGGRAHPRAVASRTDLSQ